MAWSLPVSLRRHNPDQVLRVVALAPFGTRRHLSFLTKLPWDRLMIMSGYGDAYKYIGKERVCALGLLDELTGSGDITV